LILPLIAMAAIDLWRSGHAQSLFRWLSAIALAASITLATKIAFFGWGLSIPGLDFTGVSGHALLATAVLPVIMQWMFAPQSGRLKYAGAGIGLLIAIAVGASRVELGYHSWSEVILAWGLGTAVCVIALTALPLRRQKPGALRFSPLLLLLAINPTFANYLPTHAWEVQLSLALSGRDQPFKRPPTSAPVAR